MANIEKFFVRGFIKFINKQIQEVEKIRFPHLHRSAYHCPISEIVWASWKFGGRRSVLGVLLRAPIRRRCRKSPEQCGSVWSFCKHLCHCESRKESRSWTVEERWKPFDERGEVSRGAKCLWTVSWLRKWKRLKLIVFSVLLVLSDWMLQTQFSTATALPLSRGSVNTRRRSMTVTRQFVMIPITGKVRKIWA